MRAATDVMHDDSLIAQEFLRLADSMVSGTAIEAGPQPPYLVDKQWSFLPPVVIDTAPWGIYWTANLAARLYLHSQLCICTCVDDWLV